MSRFAATIFPGVIASLGFLSSAAGLHAQQTPAETDKPHSLSTISERVRPCIDNREISGAVTLVATPDRIVHLDAIGRADLGADRPMRPDAIFWIASMTKPITATAVMMLRDEGKLSVEDPVEKHLVEFRPSGPRTENRRGSRSATC